MATNSLLTPPLQDLPTPKEESVPYVQPQVEQLQPWQGFAGTGGQVANIASNFLTGWMAGKHLKEMKMRQDAVTQIGNTKAAADVAAQTVRNLQMQGKKEGDPEFDQAKRALTGAWNAYLQGASQYVSPPEDQKKSVGSKIKDKFTAQGPHLFTAAALQALQHVDPMSLVPGQTPQEKMNQDAAQRSALDLKQKQQVDQMQQSYTKAVGDIYKKGATPDEQQAAWTEANSIRQQMAGLGHNIEPIPQPGTYDFQRSQMQFAQQQMKQKQDALSKLQGGTPFAQLSDSDKIALTGNVPQDHLQFYLKNVKSEANPNGQFNSELDAVQAMQRDAQRFYPRAYATPMEEVRRDVASSLQHTLQNPAEAQKYGIPPLKQDEQPPDWIVSQEALKEYDRRYKGATAPKVDWTQARLAKSGVLQDVAGSNPDFKDFLQPETLGGQQYFSWKPPAGGGMRSIYGHLPGFDSNDQIALNYKKFQQGVLNRARQEFPDSEIRQIFPELIPLMGQEPAPAGSAPAASGGAPAANSPMRPPTGLPPIPAKPSAAAPSPSPVSSPTNRTISVTSPDGQTQVYRGLTDAQVQQMTAAAKAKGGSVTTIDIQ